MIERHQKALEFTGVNTMQDANLLYAQKFVFEKIGEDWIFLAILGVVMALLSYALDYTIAKFQIAHVQLFGMLNGQPVLQYFAWVGFPIVLVVFSAGFVHLVSANAIGSGIPEMKTILRGVILKEYLTFSHSCVKGHWPSDLSREWPAHRKGSKFPLKLCYAFSHQFLISLGPFVHLASIVSTLLGKVIVSFRGVFQNESRNSEMLAAACAVGVSCNFAAPIGGVLFSIEVTSVYFAVRNYWRGFFGAVCGAFMFRLLAVFNKEEETITALFKTNFRIDFPFDVQELIAFAFIGIVCGFGGALFVYTHRKIVDFIRGQKKVKRFLEKNRFIYPTLIALIVSTMTFPLGLGRYMAGELTAKEQINELFSNTTLGGAPEDGLKPWHRPNVYITLVVFIIMEFWMTALAVTLPVPTGVFMPVFTIGAAFGRLVGESMAAWFPRGAAALSGSVTHTISTSVIVFELTGQITHILPVMIAVLIANAISQLLQPSFYDSIIKIKKLPYLPDISHAGSATYDIFVEQIMVKNVKFISWLSTYKDLKDLLDGSEHSSYPLVDSPENMVLLGSMQRGELEYLLEKKIGRARRLIVVTERKMRERGADEEDRVMRAMGQNATIVSFHRQSDGNTEGGGITISPVEDKTPRETEDHYDTINSASTTSNRSDSSSGKRYKLPFGEFEDMTVEEQEAWEAEELKDQLDLKDSHIDPAPFQLVERTSLHKVHSLFSLLGLSHAYVTTLGRLVGIVALKEWNIPTDTEVNQNHGQIQKKTTTRNTGGGSELRGRVEMEIERGVTDERKEGEELRQRD
ncbi:putative chloride channel protein 2 [Apostichopus japonicus]|uniref:Putative chloride channel protein 2 n=1 Tax=Stichopus japonicus TaxID=307972 RepID=A0A2G8L3U7_STIJA|nr:putative chloride channel protein 2 [Apostichopus japonicus]